MKKAVIILVALLIILSFSLMGTGAGWGPQHTLKVGAGQTYATINDALAAAVNGDTILVFPGTYSDAINIENFSGLSIKGLGFNVILKPSTTLPWNIGGYTTDRQAAIRVVNSTNINLENLVMDFALVRGNSVFGILYFDSTGSVTGNVIKNMSLSDAAGYYYEIGSCFRATGYTDAARAKVSITRNTFIDAGRVAVLTHNFVNATITGNTFYKTFDDFGYAVEMGSTSTGTISSNTIYNYDTPALSDNSNSGGLYVENCFTSGLGPFAKPVSVTGNNIYNCQWALCVGNEFDGYAGDVDINLMLMNNNFHDNIDGAVTISDEDKTDGSSVTVTGIGNKIVGNGGFGYHIGTFGDGDIKVSLKSEKICGQDTGIYVEDLGAPSISTYSVQITQSDINDNTTFGINNTVAGFTVEATKNWWGAISGPNNAALNPGGQGNAVSSNVNFNPWLKRANISGFFSWKNHGNHFGWSWPRWRHTPQH